MIALGRCVFRGERVQAERARLRARSQMGGRRLVSSGLRARLLEVHGLERAPLLEQEHAPRECSWGAPGGRWAVG
jgi:hypothetical protein